MPAQSSKMAPWYTFMDQLQSLNSPPGGGGEIMTVIMDIMTLVPRILLFHSNSFGASRRACFLWRPKIYKSGYVDDTGSNLQIHKEEV